MDFRFTVYSFIMFSSLSYGVPFETAHPAEGPNSNHGHDTKVKDSSLIPQKAKNPDEQNKETPKGDQTRLSGFMSAANFIGTTADIVTIGLSLKDGKKIEYQFLILASAAGLNHLVSGISDPTTASNKKKGYLIATNLCAMGTSYAIATAGAGSSIVVVTYAVKGVIQAATMLYNYLK